MPNLFQHNILPHLQCGRAFILPWPLIPLLPARHPYKAQSFSSHSIFLLNSVGFFFFLGETDFNEVVLRLTGTENGQN